MGSPSRALLLLALVSFPGACSSDTPKASEEIALAEAIAAKWMEAHAPEELAWDWGESVAVIGLLALHEVSGDGALLAYATAWIDHHIEAGYLVNLSDRCPPAVAALAVFEATGDPKYLAVVEEVLAYLEAVPRTEHGGFSHMGTITLFEPTLWVDSLFMFGSVLVGWAEHSGEAEPLDTYSEQFTIFADVLQEEGGFFTHAWGWLDPNDPDLFWARGNAWVVAAGYDYLRLRAQRGEADEPVRASLEALTAAFASTQVPETGLWWTLPSHPGELYQETSAAALVAFGLARAWRHGLVGDEELTIAKAALAGVRSRIELGADGVPTITGISGPTTAGGFSAYAGVELGEDISYGVGATLLALTELSGL